MSVRLTVENQTRRCIDVPWLRQRLRHVMRLLGIREGAWSITIIRDQPMAELHLRTMRIAGTTDVLTFDLRDLAKGRGRKDREGSAVDVDSVLCADEAARRAREMNVTLAEELLLYAIHSLLHVQGYDDISPPRAKRMHAREDDLLQALGIGAIYGKPAAPRQRRRR